MVADASERVKKSISPNYRTIFRVVADASERVKKLISPKYSLKN